MFKLTEKNYKLVWLCQEIVSSAIILTPFIASAIACVLIVVYRIECMDFLKDYIPMSEDTLSGIAQRKGLR